MFSTLHADPSSMQDAEPRKKGQAHHESLVAQWLQRSTGIFSSGTQDFFRCPTLVTNEHHLCQKTKISYLGNIYMNMSTNLYC